MENFEGFKVREVLNGFCVLILVFIFLFFKVFGLVSLGFRRWERKKERRLTTQHYPFILSWIKQGVDPVLRGLR